METFFGDIIARMCPLHWINLAMSASSSSNIKANWDDRWNPSSELIRDWWNWYLDPPIIHCYCHRCMGDQNVFDSPMGLTVGGLEEAAGPEYSDRPWCRLLMRRLGDIVLNTPRFNLGEKTIGSYSWQKHKKCRICRVGNKAGLCWLRQASSILCTTGEFVCWKRYQMWILYATYPTPGASLRFMFLGDVHFLSEFIDIQARFCAFLTSAVSVLDLDHK